MVSPHGIKFAVVVAHDALLEISQRLHKIILPLVDLADQEQVVPSRCVLVLHIVLNRAVMNQLDALDQVSLSQVGMTELQQLGGSAVVVYYLSVVERKLLEFLY